MVVVYIEDSVCLPVTDEFLGNMSHVDPHVYSFLHCVRVQVCTK